MACVGIRRLFVYKELNMTTPDFQTVKAFAEARFIEKKSEFIGYISPVSTNDEAVEFINSIKAQHRKATHNVYAYIVRDGNISRYSDDGEPQGTAGVPVLEVLRKEGLTDICCVVTRYFGGILLGGGGLVRAYSHSAKLAVDAAERMIMCACYPVEITSDYNLYGKISYILPEFGVKITDTDFGSDVTVKLLCKRDMFGSLESKITDISNGSAKIVKYNESFENFA
ncbi:MAG: YigZ family protein [Huintestinicola sp.]